MFSGEMLRSRQVLRKNVPRIPWCSRTAAAATCWAKASSNVSDTNVLARPEGAGAAAEGAGAASDAGDGTGGADGPLPPQAIAQVARATHFLSTTLASPSTRVEDEHRTGAPAVSRRSQSDLRWIPLQRHTASDSSPSIPMFGAQRWMVVST